MKYGVDKAERSRGIKRFFGIMRSGGSTVSDNNGSMEMFVNMEKLAVTVTTREIWGVLCGVLIGRRFGKTEVESWIDSYGCFICQWL
jgi:hypothetical protein